MQLSAADPQIRSPAGDLELALPPQPLEVVLDQHPVEHGCFVELGGHRPIFPVVAGVEVALLAAAVIFEDLAARIALNSVT